MDRRLVPLLLLIVLVGLLPFGNALLTSFHSDVYGQRSFVGIGNYRYFIGDEALGYSLNITLGWALAATVLIVAGGVLLAEVLARRSRSSKLLFGLLLIPWAIPVYIAVPVWRAFIHGSAGDSVLGSLLGTEFNLLTDPGAAVLTTLAAAFWTGVPMTAFLIAGALRRIPASSLEAARIDGADRGGRLLHVQLPQARGTLLVVTVLTFIRSFKEFSVVYLLTAGGPPLVSGITSRHILGATSTLGVFLYEVFSETDDFGLVSAFTVIVLAFVTLSLLLWIYVRRPRRRLRPLVLAAAVIHPLLGGWTGLIWGLASLAGWFRKRLILAAAAMHVAYTLVQVLRLGFLRGFQPAVLLSLVILAVFRFHTDGRHGRRNHPLLSAMPALASILVTAVTLTIAGFLVVVAVSRVNVLTPRALFSRPPTAEHFRTVLRSGGLWQSYLNTLLLAASTALLISLFTFPAAAALADMSGRRSTRFLTAVQLTSLSGGMHTLIPLYAMFVALGLASSYLPLVLIYVFQAVPLALFTTYAFLCGLPGSLKDQARLDGVGRARYITAILVPLARPVLVTSAMMAFLGAWNGFMAPLLFIADETRYTVSVRLFAMLGTLGSPQPRWNAFAAASLVNLALISALFVRFHRPLSLTALEHAEE